MAIDLKQEEQRLTELLVGKVVRLAKRNRQTELMLEFADGSRLFVDGSRLNLSVTGGSNDV
jgi:hypothetical protein